MVALWSPEFACVLQQGTTSRESFDATKYRHVLKKERLCRLPVTNNYIILCYIILYYTILYYTIIIYNYIVLYCIVLYCIILYYIILYYIILYILHNYLYIYIIQLYLYIYISADPCRQQGERVREEMTSNKCRRGRNKK